MVSSWSCLHIASHHRCLVATERGLRLYIGASRQNKMELDPGKHIFYAFFCSTDSFHKISPSRALVYHACFDDFECARLEVPMDWRPSDRSETNSTVAVAVIRLSAKVPVTDERWGGAVLLNPGTLAPLEMGIQGSL